MRNRLQTMRMRRSNPWRRGLALLAVLCAGSLPAYSAKRVTVEQLQQSLRDARVTHQKDDAVQRKLTDVELAFRASAADLRGLLGESPGPRTTEMLRAITAASAFLDPAPGAIPAIPPPEIAEQKAILGKAVHYVAQVQRTLPDFLATRETWQFNDSPRAATEADWPSRTGLHFLGRLEAPIAFRDGRESDDPSLFTRISAKGGASRKAEGGKGVSGVPGLSSWGEFGPILGVVLVDAAKGKLSWLRWEEFEGKQAGVFQFSVDRANSHYTVQYKGSGSTEIVGSHYGTASTGAGPNGGPAKGIVKQDASSVQRQAAGYHGTLTVDPESGTILRIAIDAVLRAEDGLQRAGMIVEYGTVEIGDNTYTCPVHSVSISASSVPYQSSPVSAITTVTQTQLNDVVFGSYRRFGSEATLIAELPPAASAPHVSAGVADATVEPVATAPEDAGLAVPAPAAPAVPAAKADEEVVVSALKSLPGGDAVPGGGKSATDTATDSATPFTLKASTRLVDVALIALDKRGKPLTDLKQDEVEIYDNGRRQRIQSFHAATPDSKSNAGSAPAAAAEPGTFTNSPDSVPQTGDAPDLLILLIDESHLPFQDLNRARGEMLRFLGATRADSRIALYSVSERGFRILQDVTQDHALMAKKLAAWMPDATAVSQAQALERRNRQLFDTVHNVEDLNNVNGNSIEAPDTMQTIDPELRQMGDNPLRGALGSMVALARHFASMPGHKSLAWISGDSALVNWDDRAVGVEKSPNDLTAALNHTKEALNEAHVSLYAVDASAIPVGAAAVDASLYSANVQLNPTATANSAPGGGSARDTGIGRVAEQFQSETRGIQGPVRQLAESTGGRAVNKGGDLKAILDGIESDSTALYEVGFNPDTPADGKFHTLTLKVPARKDVKLRYRTGYLYKEEAAPPKERLQQAIWAPQDVTAVRLTAEAVAATESSSGKGAVRLRIAFPGLALTQKGDRWSDDLYIFIAVRDDATQQAQVSGDTLRLSLQQATYDTGMPTGIPYHRDIEVSSAAKFKMGSVRVLVVDGNSGRMGSVTLPGSAFQP